MTQLNLNSPVGDWVAAHPQTSRVFEMLEIDYCCGGERSLEQACWDRGVDPQAVRERLTRAITEEEPPARDWLTAPLAELCDHIEQTHHVYLKEELPRLTEMLAKVAQAHGANHPELAELRDVFASLRAELEPHMFKEERILFPAVRRLERSEEPVEFPFGSVANPVRMMEQEHDGAGEALSRIHALTRGYEVPEDACNTYRALLARLHDLERDMHLHIHKENNILFPRALRREGERVRS